MEYRQIKRADADKVAKLLMKCFNISSLKEGKETFRHEMDKHQQFIVAEENDKFLGLISWNRQGLLKHQLARIVRICILANPNRTEIAEGLLRAAIQDADKRFKKRGGKVRKMYTMVHSSDNKLRNFYKKMGFVEETQLRDHYYKGVDEHVMSMWFE